jgi:hypothetical protein
VTKVRAASCALAAAACVVVGGCGGGQGAAGDPRAATTVATRVAALREKIATLEQRKTRIEDANAIERLQAAYGYYVDKGLWDEVADLFADDGTIEIALDGVYAGKARVREYLYALGGGRSGLPDGQLDEHLQVMPVITLAPDGQTAKARWRGILLEGTLGGDAYWGEGPYENEYVKDNGVWKIKTLHWYQALLVPYAGGWQTRPDPTGGKHVTSLTPDRPTTVDYKTWPETYVPPFSFPNPVAKYVPASAPAAGQ